MSGRLQYVPAKEEHISLIFEQAKEIVDLYEDKETINYEAVLLWMERKIRRQISKYTCVMCEDKVVAFYNLNATQNEYELDDLYVLPPYRNQGIGSEIIKRSLLQSKGNVCLVVFTKNTGAMALYERFGFVITQQLSPTRVVMTHRG